MTTAASVHLAFVSDGSATVVTSDGREVAQLRRTTVPRTVFENTDGPLEHQWGDRKFPGVERVVEDVVWQVAHGPAEQLRWTGAYRTRAEALAAVAATPVLGEDGAR